MRKERRIVIERRRCTCGLFRAGRTEENGSGEWILKRILLLSPPSIFSYIKFISAVKIRNLKEKKPYMTSALLKHRIISAT
jgi:hypothetical protein